MSNTGNQMKHTNPDRDGVTLIEVIFAMGVALIGLVGLISVLPVAGRRAQDAIHLNDGAALANSVFAELRARGSLERAAWRVRADYDFGVRGQNRISTVNPDRSTPDAIDSGLSFCIDPLFVSAGNSGLVEAPSEEGQYVNYSLTAGNGYRRMLFPYYRAEQNPLVDPSDSDSNGAGPASTRWFTPNAIGGNNARSNTAPILPGEPAQFGARMIRVGLGGPISGLQTAREAEQTSDDHDGIAVSKTKDRSLNVTMQGQQVTQNGFQFGKQLTDGALSWIATCNQLPGTNFMSVSIVILNTRDRNFFTPFSTSAIARNPSDNAVDERLAYVTYYTGFNGGAGGSINLVAAANVSSELSANDWVMLSRRISGGAVHRWYRVVSVGKEPQKISLADPVHNVQRSVWQNQVFLDGPDWSFGSSTQTADATVIDNTYVTIVKDVVAVSENVILME